MKTRFKDWPAGLYALTAQEFSNGRSTLDIAKSLVEAGVPIIQYREKDNKSMREQYLDCLEIRNWTRRAGILFIVNDYTDLAMAVDADGVHIGQDDMPVEAVRFLLGPDKWIGLSTHGPEQAMAAMNSGADYIGVGPIFSTATKKNVCAPVGLEYLEYVVKNIPMPFVAIGGIKESCLDEVLRAGARTVAMVTAIVGAPDVKDTAYRINRWIKDCKASSI